jgi:hypothetical protein
MDFGHRQEMGSIRPRPAQVCLLATLAVNLAGHQRNSLSEELEAVVHMGSWGMPDQEWEPNAEVMLKRLSHTCLHLIEKDQPKKRWQLKQRAALAASARRCSRAEILVMH